MADPMKTPILGVIGGSGVYSLDGLSRAEWAEVDTPFGAPSDALLMGQLGGVQMVFLPRHGRGHRHTPSTVNYRANLWAMKALGVTDILSVSAVGSLKEDLPPGTFVLVDQFIDRTFAREKSFFGTGLVGHVPLAHPICSRLGDAVAAAAAEIGQPIRRGGTYMVMEGPQFSTKAESELYRAWGCSVIGMTNMPEAKLAREAEICYASIAMVTDFDGWHPDHDAVTVEQVVRVAGENAAKVRHLLQATVPHLAAPRGPCRDGCDTALEHAIMTAPAQRDPAMLEALKPLLARVLA
ncbi:MAG: S-methyl-5'-thioadenosine phosphorylase [Elstera sp.]